MSQGEEMFSKSWDVFPADANLTFTTGSLVKRTQSPTILNEFSVVKEVLTVGKRVKLCGVR